MRVTFLQSCIFGGIKPRVHAGQNRETPRWRQGKLPLVAERGGIGIVRSEHLVKNFGHGTPSN
jgi:hypothetical protein